jgi:AraC-like DNA-binding protein
MVPLVGGDFVFLPSPHCYSLSSSPEIPARSALDVISDEEFRRSRTLVHGGGGSPTFVIAGCFKFATPESEWLIKHLPPMIRVSASDSQSPPWFQSTLQFLDAELSQNLPGSSLVVDRLADVMLVHALRTRTQSPILESSPSWLRGLADPQIAAALHGMYSRPGVPWTVPELARAASMSRSVFAGRFLKTVGTTPLEHLTQWRMMRAASMMREDRSVALAAVADAVGYNSESAFGKAFRRIVGVAPGRYRKLRERAGELATLLREELGGLH